MTIGEKIQYYRQLRGLTQTQLASSTGISISMIKKYEIGNRNPKQAYLQKIASVFGISVNVFLDIQADTLGDIAPYLLALSKKCGINFEVQKNSQGEEIADGIKISFDSPSLNVFLKKWADHQKKMDDLRAEALSIPDSTIQADLLSKIDLIDATFENSLVDTQIMLEQKK